MWVADRFESYPVRLKMKLKREYRIPEPGMFPMESPKKVPESVWSDRSRCECGHACPRKRWWSYHYGDRGLVPPGSQEHLAYGLAVHNAAELKNHHKILRLEGMPEELEQEFTPEGHSRMREWESLYTGHTAVFRELVLPKIENEYIWSGSEIEGTLELRPGINWMYRLDGVLVRKSDGLMFLLEIKTSSWPDKLTRQAPRNFQLMMELEAMRDQLDLKPEMVGGALLLVFNKGQRRKVSEAEAKRGLEGYRRISPFTYWYKRELAGGDVDYSLEYRKGFTRTPVWEIPRWYALGSDIFKSEFESQVTLTPSISFDPVFAQQVKQQVINMEQFYAAVHAYQGLFVQNFSNCRNDGGYGRDCEYDALCFSPNAARDPLAAGYSWRIPNHPQEPIPLKQEDIDAENEEVQDNPYIIGKWDVSPEVIWKGLNIDPKN